MELPGTKGKHTILTVSFKISEYASLARCAGCPGRDRPPWQLRGSRARARPRPIGDHLHGAPDGGGPGRAALRPARASRAVHPPAGRALLAEGRMLLAAAADVEQRVRRVATGWEAELRIAVDALIPLARVFPLIAAFDVECRAEGSAHTQLRIAREVLGGTWDALAEGRADLVLGASGEAPAGGGYRLRVLADTASVFAVAPRHPLADAPSHCRNPPSPAIAPWWPPIRRAGLRPARSAFSRGRTRLPCPTSTRNSPRRSWASAVASFPSRLPRRISAAGRLVARAVETPRPPQRVHAAWRTPRPGKALTWWIDAIGQADWRFLAVTRTPPAAPVVAPRLAARRSRR